MNSLLAIFLIITLGYFLGSVSVKGLSLGTSGILIIALVFGHFGVEIPAIVKNFGLALFVGTVGMIAGPVFFRNFKKACTPSSPSAFSSSCAAAGSRCCWQS